MSGEQQQAYLYDTNYPAAFDPVYLGSQVSDIQFQLDDAAKLSGIVTVLDDGALNMFDPNGKPVGQIVYSPDRTRKVDISGDDRAAYLYDASDSPAFDPVYLGSDVVGVQFQATEDGQTVVLVLNKDNSTNTYDAYGNLIGVLPAPQAQTMSATQAKAPQGFMSAVRMEMSAAFKALISESLNW